jgi:hypothetical protein
MQSDLYKMADRAARQRAAIAVLEDLGFVVQLQRRQNQPRPGRHRPTLEVVADSPPVTRDSPDDKGRDE